MTSPPHHQSCRIDRILYRVGLLLTINALLMPALAAQAEISETGKNGTTPSGSVHRNSLGTDFVEVPGTTVKFAKFETRVSDFDIFLKESGYSWKEKPFFEQTGEHPVVNVNLADAAAFCKWLTNRERKSGEIQDTMFYRLPTNADWDAAAEVATTALRKDPADLRSKRSEEIFPWGTQWPPPKGAGNFNSKKINGTDDGFVYTAPVGSFQPSTNGIYDLAGNVWEWVTDESQISADSASLRGGSWQYFRKECLISSYRYIVPATIRRPSIGFRCVLEDITKSKSALAVGELSEKKARELLTTRTAVDSADVERIKLLMSRKNDISDDDKRAAMSRLLIARNERADFVNSLNMNFQFIPGASVLFCEHEVRVRDLDAWTNWTGKTRTGPPFAQTKEHPAVNISWIEAKAFCAWLTEHERSTKAIDPGASYRLPTDAEWSLAAGLVNESGDTPEARHLGNKVDFPWGQEWPPAADAANINSAEIGNAIDRFPYTAPVRSHNPNSLHLYDLAGNVAEWCEDEWSHSDSDRVVRGGSWRSSAKTELLSSARQHFKNSETRPDLGFRIVLINQSH
ncbi:MAG: SUMF1/EgtB/PvdO family nonheme iron enzyme [Verrucomicrobiaceae bacterium]